MSEKGLSILAKKNVLNGVSDAKLRKCSHCLAGKQRRVSFMSSEPKRKSKVLDLVHSDVCGPMKTQSLGGAYYFVTFIDDCSRKTWAYTLKTKDKVLDTFKTFQASVERETGKKLKCIRTDNRGEYIGPFDKYCQDQGIRYQKSLPKTPQLNGLAERMNRTLVERVRCLLSQSKLPKYFWGEALSTVVHLLNLTPCVSLKFEFQIMFGVVKMLPTTIFGCLDAWLMCIFRRMRDRNWMRSRRNVCLLGMDLMSLGIDSLIRFNGNLFVVVMSYSWRIIPLRT